MPTKRTKRVPSAEQDAPSLAARVVAVSAIPPLLSAPELARLLGRSRSSIYRKVAAGELPPPKRIGGCPRWLGSEIAALIADAEEA